MARLVARALLLLGLALAGPAFAGEPLTEAISTLNAVRAERGLDPVVERPELSRAAGNRAAAMARRSTFELETPGAVSIREWLARSGYVPPASRMLLTAGYPDPQLLLESLLGDHSSAGALLDPSVGEIGLGHAAGPYRLRDGRIVTHAWLLILAETRFTPVVDAGDRLLAAINGARGRRGLQAVSLSPALAGAAGDHARDMVARGFFDHLTPDGGNVADRARRHSYDYRKLGENLAVGQATPEAVIRAWTDSPGHASVLFDPQLREVGVGYIPGPLRRPPNTYNHVWVAVFGTRH